MTAPPLPKTNPIPALRPRTIPSAMSSFPNPLPGFPSPKQTPSVSRGINTLQPQESPRILCQKMTARQCKRILQSRDRKGAAKNARSATRSNEILTAKGSRRSLSILKGHTSELEQLLQTRSPANRLADVQCLMEASGRPLEAKQSPSNSYSYGP